MNYVAIWVWRLITPLDLRRHRALRATSFSRSATSSRRTFSGDPQPATKRSQTSTSRTTGLCALIEFTDKQLILTWPGPLQIQGEHQAYREDSRQAGTSSKEASSRTSRRKPSTPCRSPRRFLADPVAKGRVRYAEARRRRQCARAGTRLFPATGAPVLPGAAEYTAQSICSLSSSEHMPGLDFIVPYPREPQPRPPGEHPWLSSHLRPQTGDGTYLCSCPTARPSSMTSPARHTSSTTSGRTCCFKLANNHFKHEVRHS